MKPDEFRLRGIAFPPTEQEHTLALLTNQSSLRSSFKVTPSFTRRRTVNRPQETYMVNPILLLASSTCNSVLPF